MIEAVQLPAFPAEPIRSQPASRIGWLDSMRGVCCLMVMALHYFHIALIAMLPILLGLTEMPEQKVLRQTIELYRHSPFSFYIDTIADWIFGYWDIGKIAVIGFFLVSGFVIPSSLKRGRGKPVLQFCVSRFFRLYPVYWISLALAIGIGFFHEKTWSFIRILANITMFHKYLLVDDINGVAWTLQMELGFYFLCVLLFITNALHRPRIIVLMIYAFMMAALALAFLRYLSHWSAPVAFPLWIAIMFLGYYYRLFSDRESGVSRNTLLMAVLPLVPLIALICRLAYAPYMQTYFFSYVLGILMPLAFSRFQWNHPALKSIGGVSYGIYLLHALIGAIVIPCLIHLAPDFYKRNILLLFIPMLVSSAVTMILSYLIGRFVEQPCIDYGRRLNKRLSASSLSVSPVTDLAISPYLAGGKTR